MLDLLPFKIPTSIIDKAVTMIVSIVIAFIIYKIGKFVAQKLSDLARGAMEKSKIDATLVSFGTNLVFGVMMLFVIMAALNRIGVDTSSIVALIAGATVAIGLALQDQLSNFAAGVLIILFRPFNKGDYVEINGHAGTVEDIHLLTTSLRSVNNNELVIPNGQITSSALTNYSSLPTRRVDVVVGIGYSSNIKLAKDTMLAVAQKHQLILSDPAPVVAVSALGGSSVDLKLCVWSSNSDWLQVQCDLNEQIKIAFDEKEIEIPFPQQVVYMHNQN